jgi:phosphohistidine phosphatase
MARAMDLILWRHAEAEEQGDGQDDLARVLTPKGERQAQRMAAWLNRHLADSTRVLVSPAQRCQQTAAALGRSVRTVPGLGPEASVDELLRLARWPQSGEPVLVVGHQPVLGIACARLLSGADQAWHIKKGAVWWMRQREREGVAGVFLQTVQAPDAL